MSGLVSVLPSQEVKVKLDKDLVEAKARNDRIAWKKQEQAN